MSILVNNLAVFLNLIAEANAVSIDNGPFLSDWELSEEIDAGDDNSMVVTFRFEDQVHIDSESFDVGGINLGTWSEDGESFVLKNTNGEYSTINFYKAVRMNNRSTSTPPSTSLMDKVEKAAISQFLTDYPTDVSLEDVQKLILDGDDSIIIWQKFEDEDPKNLVDMINDMVYELRELVVECSGDPGRASPVIPATPAEEIKPARVLVEIDKSLCSWKVDGNVSVHVRNLDIEPNATVPPEFADLA